jgi:tetratricopeptide (TPR) repeat protein
MTTTEKASHQKVNLFGSPLFQEKVNQFSSESLQKFRVQVQSTWRLHLIFFALAVFEVGAFIILSLLSKSLFIAFTIAGFFLTIFSYFLIRFYHETKTSQELQKIHADFLKSCEEVAEEEGSFLKMAHALMQCASLLNFKNLNLLSGQPFLEKCRIWMHWKETHRMKEILFQSSVSFHIKGVKKDPCDLETHASLAHAYLSLAKLYQAQEDWPWAPQAYFSKIFEERFKTYAEKAVQELKILESLVPHDPWVHRELASLYRLLQLPQKEIEEHEILLKISPNDRELVLRLGILYFEQGMQAKALLFYDRLKKAKDPKAEELISFYDASPLPPL